MINPNTLNMYSSKTDQIMSKYRPIAPKPQLPLNPSLQTQQSRIFKNLSTHIQARPSKAKKRGRSGTSPSIYKKAKTNLSGSSCLAQLTLPLPSWAKLMSSESNGSLENPLNLFPFTLLPYPSKNPYAPFFGTLNSDLGCMKEKIITPQPIRPIGSSISVKCISEADPSSNSTTACISKKPEEVEAEVESDDLPAVVSDSNNKVRLANSAYKEMVGQPECLWLDLMTNHDGQLRGSTCKRISGEVMLELSDSPMTVSSNGFSCKARIDWAKNGQKSSINAPCDVMRLSCESKDYLFTWRFHTREAYQSNNPIA